MRITNKQITGTYLYNANKNLEKYTSQHEKLETGRAYTKISQNVSTSKKALQARTEMYRNEQYQKNVDSAIEELSTAESSLTSVNDQLQNINSLVIKAVNGTNNDETSRKIFSKTLDESKENILESLNTSHLDKYILGGTNNKEIPFTKDENGNLMFNGVNVDNISEKNGLLFDENGNEIPMSNDNYIDIGLGLKMNGDNFDKNSAFKISFSGVKWTGYGFGSITYKNSEQEEVTEEVSNNVYQIMSDMQDALDKNDMPRLSALNDHLKKQYDNVLTGIAEIGVKSKRLEDVKTQLDDKNAKITQMQKDFEWIEDTDEIVKLDEYNYSWLLTLKFGSSLLPQSLLDYIK